MRVVQSAEGWECHRGRATISTHRSLGGAVLAAIDLAFQVAPAAVFIHRSDGSVVCLGHYSP